MLCASEASFRYSARGDAARSERFALQNVSVTMERGRITGLLGPNGGGKTTLLKLLSGINAPERGRVTLDGVDLASMARRRVAQRIAVVPQETHPAFDYTVMEMVLMGRHPHLSTFQLEGPDDLRIAHDALQATGTDHLSARAFATLSGGEKQRVIIASALAQASDVLLLDEPTASLDLGYQLDVAALLQRLNRERQVTMAIATHDLNLAASLCDTLILVREGQVLAAGRTDEVLTAPMIRRLYGVDADVRLHERAGHLTVVPVGRAR